MKWKEIRLGDLAHIIMGQSPPSKYYNNLGQGLPFFQGRKEFTEYYPVIEQYTSKITKIAEQDDILFTVRAPVGDINIAPCKCCIGRGLSAIKSNEKNKYLYYFLKNSKQIFVAKSSGTVYDAINKDNLSNTKIPLPPLPIQKKIASILSAYDDLIENNLRRIELLEKSARELYKEWFVRFKFPGHEKVKFKDGLPEGWERKKLGEVCQAIGGGTPSTKVNTYWDNGTVVWFTPTDLSKNNSLILIDSGKKITEQGLKKSSAKLLPSNTILMTSRASIGYFGLFNGVCCTNQGFISVIPNDESQKYYIMYNLINRVDEIISLASGSTYKEINKTTFRDIDILIPAQNITFNFYQYVKRIIEQLLNIKQQNKLLKQARGLLLPRLMKGEIEV